MSLQRHVSSTLSLRKEILDIVNDDPEYVDKERVLELTEALEAACYKCSKRIPGEVGEDSNVFKHNLADLLIRRFLLCLHQWIFRWAPTFPRRSNLSRKVCIDAATTLASPLPSKSFESVAAQARGFFRGRINQVVVATTLTILTELDHIEAKHRSIPLLQASVQLDVLIAALREALDQCLDRVRRGSTQIRMYIRGSVTLALAEGTPSGMSRKRLTTGKAFEAAQTCYAIMETRRSALLAERSRRASLFVANRHSTLAQTPGPFGDELTHSDFHWLGFRDFEYPLLGIEF